jgi:hypothetical protein
VVHATLDGWPLDLSFDMPPASVSKALARLSELGYTPRAAAPQQPAQPAQKAARPKVDPLYQPDGTPCCPVHLRPLTEGQYGLYCSSKAKEGQAADKRGYCGLKFPSDQG